jgi:hypothetical protein
MIKNKDHLTLIMALAMPILFILILTGYLYLSPLIVKPQNNFLYYFDDNNSESTYSYSIENNQLNATAPNYYYNQKNLPLDTTKTPDSIYPTLYIYNVTTDQSQPVTFDQTGRYKYIGGNISPEGFEVVHGSSGGGGLFFNYSSSNYEDFYLKKNGYSKKLNLNTNSSNYYNFEFLGWVKN